MSTDKLYIRDKHFYKNGEKVAIEFGNWEQINCHRKYCEKTTELLNGVEAIIDVDTDEIQKVLVAGFYCVCDRYLYVELKGKDEEDVYEFDGHDVTCYRCKRHYEFSIDMYGELCVKLTQ